MNLKEKQELIEQAIQLETNVATLYTIFCHAHTEHAELWSQLSQEEKGHAALIKNATERCDLNELLNDEAISANLTKLERCNHHIQALIEQFAEAPPTSVDAFTIALDLEQSAGEIHYQQFMDIGDGSILDRVFQKLDQEDKAHSARLRAYMLKHDIPIVGYLEREP
ncbi:rubrerythrin family protein [Pseudomonadota bacterium]